MAVWNLSDIYDPKKDGALAGELKAAAKEFATLRGSLAPEMSTDEFLKIIRRIEDMAAMSSRLAAHAELWLSENTSDSARTTNLAKISQLLTGIGNSTMFFSLWFKDLDEKDAQKFIGAAGPYRYYLERIRASRPFTLSEKEEKVINVKDLTGSEAWTTMYDLFTNRFAFEMHGRKLTQEEINQYKHSANRDERVQSYEKVMGKYGEEQDVLAEMYRNIVNDWRNENVQIRGFASPIAVRNHGNDVPDAAIEALLSVVKRNVATFQDYFALKARALKLQAMDRYDLYAPFKSEQKDYHFEECKRITLETYTAFSPQAGKMAGRIFSDAHVHSDIAPGKRSGAFCYSVVKEKAPYILLNHVGKLNDLYTMMHEFGHGVHSLAAQGQTNLTFHATLPLAETASIFGEMLLSQRLLKDASKEEKIGILMRMLDGQYASITRQAYFVMFEKEAHARIENGATTDELNALYLGTLAEQFGDAMAVPKIFEHEWKYIPHIYHTPFYCYAYAFGNLLVLALYQRYRELGAKFVPQYMGILSAGGSKSPADILGAAGIDITQESFWQGGFDLIRKEVEELRGLLDA